MLKKKSVIIFLSLYFPVLVWMGFIFYLSSIPNLKTGASIPTEFVFRKIVHLMEYAILAFLLARIFARGHCLDFKRIFIFSFLIVLIFSLSDELHQSFVIGRSGNFFDVGIDLVGGIIGLLIFEKIAKLFNNQKK